MAVLADQDRAVLWADYMRTEAGTFGAMTKADLLNAVDALDAFFNANAATINAAIPLPARSALTTAQKARLLGR